MSKCEISTEILTELFDHHSVLLDFNNKNFKTRQSINNSILNHPRFPEVVLAAVVDTHLNHASDQNPAIDIAAGKCEVGAFLSLLREINEIEYDTELNGPSAERTQLKAEKNS